MKKIIMITVCMVTLWILTMASMLAQTRTKAKPRPFVKELKTDSMKYKTPVQKLDTMKNKMPVVNPKKSNVTPK